MSHPTEPQVRAPLQERSRKTLARVLGAGWSLLESDGPDGLTVAAITSKARTSVGSFYARFRGKEDLLRYMAEQALEETVAVWEGLREELPTEPPTPGTNGSGGGETPTNGSTGRGTPSSTQRRAALDHAVSGLTGLYLDGPAGRVVRLDGIEDPAPSRRRRLEDRLAGDLAGHLGGGARAELAVRILAGTLHDAASRAGEASPYPPGDVLIAEMVELLNGYLGGEVRAPERPPADERDAHPVADAHFVADAEPAADGESVAEAESVTDPEPATDAARATDEEPATDTDATPEPDDTLDPFDIWG